MYKWSIQTMPRTTAPGAMELAEMNRKLKSSEDELDRLNKWLNDAQGKFELD